MNELLVQKEVHEVMKTSESIAHITELGT